MAEWTNDWGLPQWLMALAMAVALGGGCVSALYEHIRVPELEARLSGLSEQIQYQEKRLAAAAQHAAVSQSTYADVLAQLEGCKQTNAQWAAASPELRETGSQLQACRSELQGMRSGIERAGETCSVAAHLNRLRADKSELDRAVSQVQLGYNDWNTVSPVDREKRMDELRRQSADVQAQILSVARCVK